MQYFLDAIFESAPLIPHGHCYRWQPGLVWLHVLSDGLIAVAYYSIPLMLVYFVRKRQDIPFNSLFLLFGAFIVACGTTHLMEIWTLWYPVYWLSGLLKAITALISVYTALELGSTFPQLLALPSLAATNLQLAAEVKERQQIEEELRQAKAELESRVAERTAALQASQTRLAGILEIADDAIIAIDETQQITLFNQGAERIFGYTAAEVLGQSLNLLLPSRYAQTHQQQVMNFAAVQTSARRMGERRAILGRRNDGQEFPAEASISKLDLGHEQVFTVMLRDITDRQQAADDLQDALQKLNFHVENSPLAVIEWDREFRVSRWSDMAEKIFGWQATEVMGKRPSEWQFVFEEDAESVAKVMNRLISTEEQRNITSNRNYHQDGSVIQCEWYNSALPDEAGRMESVLSLILDVTDRHKVERLKNEFISVVSHELRTPLTAIHGSLGMLASGLLDTQPEKGKRLLRIAAESTERLSRLINDILDIERIESGNIGMVKTNCAVPELIAEAVNGVQSLADQAGITIAVSAMAVQLLADRDRLIQALTNLLSNAIKFSPPDSTIWLTASEQPNWILFQVRDRGRGIPADKLGRIFERFHQVDASDSRNNKGTGLGLAICHSIVQQHSGRIWVESRLNEGSTFSFTIPISPQAEANEVRNESPSL
jgi:PAS domain S-box-containing protein